MHFEESSFQSVLYGVVDSGQDPVAQLTKICELRNIMSGTIRAMGALEDVELMRLKNGKWEDIPAGSGHYQILQWNAHIARVGSAPALRIEVLLSTDGPLGPQWVFGQLRAAKVVEMEYVLTAFDDVHAERRLDKGLLRLADVRKNSAFIPPRADKVEKPVEKVVEKPAPAAETRPAPARDGRIERIAEPRLGARADTPAPARSVPSSAPSRVEKEDEAPAMSWAEVVEASAEKPNVVRSATKPLPTPKSRKANTDEDDRALMEPGDIIDHPTLGRCRLMRIEDEDFAHIRLLRGGVRKLALEVCEVSHTGEEGGRNVFRIRIKR